MDEFTFTDSKLDEKDLKEVEMIKDNGWYKGLAVAISMPLMFLATLWFATR